MEWAASVHTLHMPKAVITFVFKVLRNGQLRCKTRQLEHENPFCRFRVFAFPSFCAFPISVRLCLIASAIIDCNVFLLSAKTAFLLCAFSRFCRFRVFAVFGFRAWRFRRFRRFRVFAFSRFRVPPAASPRPGHRFRVHSVYNHSSIKFIHLQTFANISATFRKGHECSTFSMHHGRLQERGGPKKGEPGIRLMMAIL